MNGIEIAIEFNVLDGFSRDAFEYAIKTVISDMELYLENLWCVFDKRVCLSEFPVMYFINECTMEIGLREGDEQDCVLNKIISTIKKIEASGGLYFKINSFKNRIISIKKDSITKRVNDKMKVFVTGVAGQLGHDVMNRLFEYGYKGIGSDLAENYQGIQDGTHVVNMPYVSLDIRDADNVRKIITEINPEVVIHCAAWNAVDQAEDQYRFDIVRATNTGGTKNIADACAQINCKMVYISTDYVFDGSGQEPWRADAKENRALNVYGQTKSDGESVVSKTLNHYFIVRTSWAYGINGNNFIKAMLKLGKKYNTVRVVNDQVGTPTYMKDLAKLLVDMISTEKYGYYHATNEGGYISWYDFACEIFNQAGLSTIVQPVGSDEYAINRAERPLNSRLDKRKLSENGFKLLPDWKDALRRYLEELRQQGEL